MKKVHTGILASVTVIAVAGFLWQLQVNAGLREKIAARQRQQRAASVLQAENERLAAGRADLERVDRAQEAHGERPAAPAPAPERARDEAASRADEHLRFERAFQQDIARRRAEQAKAFARFDEERATWDAAAQYHALVQQARLLAADGAFRAAIRRYNQAMELKPVDLPVTADIKELQTMLQAQNAPVNVTFRSDGETFVTVSDWKALRTFETTTTGILPGNYEVVGRRAGYRDVRVPLVLRSGMPAPVVTIACTERADTP